MKFATVPLLALIFLSASAHPIYLSVGDIEIENSQKWHATFRLFFDDLEDAIQNQDGKRPNLSTEYLEQCQPSIERYILQHFRLESEKELTYAVDTISREDDVVLVRILGKESWPSTSVVITNNILLELFEAQKNILKITTKADERLLYFNKTETVLKHPE